MGEIAPGWPPAGALVCGGQYGHTLSDAVGSAGHLFVAFGNDYFPGSAPRVQRLSRAVLDAGLPPASHALVLAPPAPNPTRGDWSVRFALRGSADVALELVDVAGRRVLGRELAGLSPGWHVASVEGGAALAPGVYRIRVRAGFETAERTLVRLR